MAEADDSFPARDGSSTSIADEEAEEYDNVVVVAADDVAVVDDVDVVNARVAARHPKSFDDQNTCEMAPAEKVNPTRAGCDDPDSPSCPEPTSKSLRMRRSSLSVGDSDAV